MGKIHHFTNEGKNLRKTKWFGKSKTIERREISGELFVQLWIPNTFKKLKKINKKKNSGNNSL